MEMKNMNKYLLVFVLCILCIILISCVNADFNKTTDTSAPGSTSNKSKIPFPILVTSFPTSTIENSYVIILSEDGTIETYWGIRKAYEIAESDYTYTGADWFSEIDDYKKDKLTNEEMAVIAEYYQQVLFSNLHAARAYVDDGWEEMLLLDSMPFYTYGFADDESLAAFIAQIIAYSPIEVVNNGWA
jgi:hypothetical protein